MEQANQNKIEYEKEFELEWDKIKHTMPGELEKYEAVANIKIMAYGFYLCGRSVASEAFIKQMKEHGHI